MSAQLGPRADPNSGGAGSEPVTGRSVGLVVAAVVAELLGLLISAFCLFLAQLATHGLFGDQRQLDRSVILPLIGIAVSLPLGPLVLSLGPFRRRWLTIALFCSVFGVVVASALTWLPIALQPS